MFSNMALASFTVFSIPSRSQEVEDVVVEGDCSVDGDDEEGGGSNMTLAFFPIPSRSQEIEDVVDEGGCSVDRVVEEGGGGLLALLPAPSMVT